MGTRHRILLFDGDANSLELVRATLAHLEYEVTEASQDDIAARANEVRPDVIILRAANNGLKILADLKRNPGTESMPVIMLTAGGEARNSQEVLSAGADELLSTPVEPAELQARVRSMVKVSGYNNLVLTYKQDVEKEAARRTQELTKAFEKIKVTSLDTVYRLSRAAEYKDEDTGAHVQRMSHYSSAIARRMGLDDKFVENILWAAPMHDIGKIGIPDRVLLKPGKLDDEEWVIMRKHTTIGAEILKDADADFIRLAAEIALTHHEKWAGNGYPKGLKGADIPLAGRIVALADVFDALTSERPYKTPFPLDKALTIIKEGRGTHFDADVTDAFLAIETEIKAEMNWWKFMASGDTPDESDLSNLFT